MTENGRIREVRKSLGLTQDIFGAKLGISGAALSNIEKGSRKVTAQIAISICREFRVSDTWLRTGEGEMFLACSRDDELEEFTNQLLKDEPENFRRRLVTAMSRLTESQWEAVSSFVDGLAEEETWNGKTREQLHAELDQALDAEKKIILTNSGDVVY